MRALLCRSLGSIGNLEVADVASPSLGPGQVRIGGRSPADPEARRLVGYVPESSAVYGDMSVRGFLRFCARLRGVGRDRREPEEPP